MARGFIVKPITRKEAAGLCARHPHAPSMPNSSKYYMRLDIRGRFAGLAVWGYGIVPRATPNHLFGSAGRLQDYLELCRFFVCDWCAKNTASKFLSITHRMIKKHTSIKWLYTYAAGFQGLVGHIYKASGYEYIGKTPISSGMILVPGIGLVHTLSQWHRYGKVGLKTMSRLFPGAKRWGGDNFRYILFLRDRANLMSHARFEVQKYPTSRDLHIFTIDVCGKKEEISPDLAREIPIVSLRSRRARSDTSDTPVDQTGKSGATPTLALSGAS